MREILFKARMTGTDGWIEGFPYSIYENGIDAIQDVFNQQLEYIDTDTLAQFTGLTDKNKVKVFEGDIVKHTRRTEKGIESTIHEVYFDTEMLEFGMKQSNELFHCQFNDEYEVIGNVHDNPPL